MNAMNKQYIEWIPIKTRKLTEEERRVFSVDDVTYIYDCALPDDGENVLVTTSDGEVAVAHFYNDGFFGCYFEYYEDEGDAIAWAKLPSPYKKGE